MCKGNYAVSVKRIMPDVPVRRAAMLGVLSPYMWKICRMPSATQACHRRPCGYNYNNIQEAFFPGRPR